MTASPGQANTPKFKPNYSLPADMTSRRRGQGAVSEDGEPTHQDRAGRGLSAKQKMIVHLELSSRVRTPRATRTEKQ